MTSKNAESEEVVKELDEQGLIDSIGLNIGELKSMVLEDKISNFKGDQYSILDIINHFIERNSSLNSFFIIDLGSPFRLYGRWRKLLPNVIPYYAVKCNPDKQFLRTLTNLGICFDVASKAEISMVRDLDVAGSRMIFANPVKEINHIMYAKSQGVKLMTFDNEDELKKISVFHPQAQLVLRILVDDSKSKMPFGSKFGCPINNLDNVLNLAKNLTLNVVGVSFHVGSGCSDPSTYASAIRQAREVFTLGEKYGFTMDLLDIGGGFPSPEEGSGFEDIAKVITEELTSSFNDGVRFVAEPGRFFATSCGTLATNVIGKKLINNNGKKVFHYYINSNLYGLFNNKIFDHAQSSFKLLNQPETDVPLYPSVIFGQTCDSMDRIADDVELPELCCGDWLYVENHGAYTIASASTFNGFPLADVHYVFTS